MGRKAHKMKRMARNIIIAIIIVAVICGLVYSWQSRQQLDYRDCLEETAFTVDGQAVQMKWLGFYVVYEEREVEKQAQIYHADNTADYWNLHVDGHFIRPMPRTRSCRWRSMIIFIIRRHRQKG